MSFGKMEGGTLGKGIAYTLQQNKNNIEMFAEVKEKKDEFNKFY